MYSLDDHNKVPLKTYNLLVTGPAGWTTVRAVCQVYQSLNGNWFADLYISGSFTSNATPTITCTGLVFKAAHTYQALACFAPTTTQYPIYCLADTNASNIEVKYSAAITTVMISGTVELESKPNFIIE